MANQVSAIREGIRYQDLYSWCEILLLLEKDSPYEYAYLEHPDACSVDDLTLFPKKDSKAPTKYFQLKWRVRQAELCSFNALIEKRSGDKSWLQQLYGSWKKLRSPDKPVEIWFVSNWAPDPVLGDYIRSRSYQIRPDFFMGGPKSKAGQARKLWTEHLAIDEAELKAFCQDLRIRAGASAIVELEDKIDERMGRFGLRRGPNARAIALDAIGNWIELGGTSRKVTAGQVRHLIRDRGLTDVPEDWIVPTNTERILRKDPDMGLWIHGWTKLGFDLLPTVELDWTPYVDFPTRRVPTQEDWNQVLFPELFKARNNFPAHSLIDFRGKLPLTSVLAVGFAFQETAGYSFRTAQPTRGEIFLWRSDAPPTQRTFVTEVEEESDSEGEEILVSFSIVGDARPEVQKLRDRLGEQLKAIVYAQPDGGYGGDSVRSAGDATALAHEAKELLKRMRSRYQASRIHLVLYAPASFCLFLGQKMNSLRTVVTYEMTKEHEYQQSVVLETR